MSMSLSGAQCFSSRIEAIEATRPPFCVILFPQCDVNGRVGKSGRNLFPVSRRAGGEVINFATGRLSETIDSPAGILSIGWLLLVQPLHLLLSEGPSRQEQVFFSIVALRCVHLVLVR